jgi:hypothetical protein
MRMFLNLHMTQRDVIVILGQEVVMRRIFLLVAPAFIIGGSTVWAAQTGAGSKTDETDMGAQAEERPTPGAAPGASPDLDVIEEGMATMIASLDLIADLATAIASPDASPVVPEDPCATPVAGTPAS